MASKNQKANSAAARASRAAAKKAAKQQGKIGTGIGAALTPAPKTPPAAPAGPSAKDNARRMAEQVATWDAQRRPVDPFLTPEQQQALAQLLAGYDNQLTDLGFNYAQQAANVARDAGDIVGGNWRDVVSPGGAYREYLGDGRLSNSGSLWARGAAQQQTADNALAARGLSRSSIRDTDLGDIETATTLARTNMLASLSQLAARNETTRDSINAARNTAQASYNEMAVQNAQGVPVTPAPTRVVAPGTVGVAPAPAAAPATKTVPIIQPKATGSVVGSVKVVSTPKTTKPTGPSLRPLAPAKSKNTVKVGGTRGR